MGKFVKQLMGKITGAPSARKINAQQQQAQIQSQAAMVNQQNAVDAQSASAAAALGQASRRRRGSRLLSADGGKATLG